ncbi:HD domain-containing protein [Erythrobacter crassostreae]|uniref:ATP-binding protein n=1 Tax=Erythrobacter crassostreae TaxID=2828328 RepID=A0A9X1F5Z5_9SPHN|nr:ATP-binding protein [Erythrobacter crassostrea]MBV7260098.1 ATP-binding protein [Erythrobacter crassostrea]
MREFENLALWKNSLGKHVIDESEKKALDDLRTNLDTFRKRAATLTEGIRAQFPQLTVHDVTHLDALWETADLIAGSKYDLNPAEAFVFGGAVLLHDAAHCFEAYEGGQTGVRETTQWKDEFAVARQRMPTHRLGDVEKEADFAAIRVLHAHAAERLAIASWKDGDGDPLFLIESFALRKAYGEIIGTIAASHHWSIERVASLPQQLNSPPDLPASWRVNPMKIACLLRCADAAHIDERRAPDFLRALFRRSGVSADHWTAQNYLNRADVDQLSDGKDVLLITSNQSFEKSEASAWWVAFDALQLIDREIRSANQLLRNSSNQTSNLEFAIKSVKGAEAPELASNYIKTRGWTPCAAKLHVSNVQGLVRELGGEKLYGAGQPLAVVLRELLQNARDAIAARQFTESGVRGKITVRVLKSDGTKTVVQVEDNGVGMSKRVLTGPFLDFGTSFWTSDLVKDEWPGLRSSKQEMVGQFGIGFYSVFMVASAVTVTSKRYDRGLVDATSLEFPNGVTLRPTLSNSRSAQFSSQVSTLVCLELEQQDLLDKAMEIPSGVLNVAKSNLQLKQYIAIIAAGLDTDVYLQEGDSTPLLAHKAIHRDMLKDEIELWARNLFDWKSEELVATQSVLNELYGRLRCLFDRGGRLKGIAALVTNFESTGHGIQTVGGLAQTVTPNGQKSFLGFMDTRPASAKREPDQNSLYDTIDIEAWLTCQIKLLSDAGIQPLDWAKACYSIASLGGDPLPKLHVLFWIGAEARVVDAQQLLELLKTRGIAIYGSTLGDVADTHHKNRSFRGMPTFVALNNGRFNSLAMEEGQPTDNSSMLSCLYRLASAQGICIVREVLKGAADGMFGKVDVHIFTIAD